MDFKTYLESRDYKNPSGQSGKLIREIDIGRVMKEKPDNLDELLEKQLDDPKNKLKLKEKLKLRTEFWIDGDNNENLRQTEFRIFKTNHFFDVGKMKTGVLTQDQLGRANLLIYPFFTWIRFNPYFNLFICAIVPKSEPYYPDYYFFDTHGRLLEKRVNHSWHRGLPPVGYDRMRREVFQIKPLPDGFSFSNAVDMYTYCVSDKHNFKAIINHKGEWVIEPNYYSNITFQIGWDIAFVRRMHATFRLNLKTSELEKLPFDIYNLGDTHLRIVNGDYDNLKWGLMDYNGNVIHEPKYDYIDFSHCLNRHVVFSGEYDEEDISPNDFDFLKKYDYAQKLSLGQCGVVDLKGNPVIPIKYDYIKEIPLGHFLVNTGCEIYLGINEYDDPWSSSLPEVEKRRFIKGGVWELYDDEGRLKRAISVSEIQKILREFHYQKDKRIAVID